MRRIISRSDEADAFALSPEKGNRHKSSPLQGVKIWSIQSQMSGETCIPTYGASWFFNMAILVCGSNKLEFPQVSLCRVLIERLHCLVICWNHSEHVAGASIICPASKCLTAQSIQVFHNCTFICFAFFWFALFNFSSLYLTGFNAELIWLTKIMKHNYFRCMPLWDPDFKFCVLVFMVKFLWIHFHSHTKYFVREMFLSSDYIHKFFSNKYFKFS